MMKIDKKTKRWMSLSVEELLSIFKCYLPKVKKKFKDSNELEPAAKYVEIVERVLDTLPKDFLLDEHCKKYKLSSDDVFNFLSLLIDRIERLVLKRKTPKKSGELKTEDRIRLTLPYLYDIKAGYFKPKRTTRKDIWYHLSTVIPSDVVDEIDLIDAGIIKELVHALKMPDPVYIVRRLKSKKEIGVLSRMNRHAFVGKKMALINEKIKPEMPIFVFGLVTIGEGKPKKSIFDVKEGTVDGISYLEFYNEKNFYYYKIIPIEIKSPREIEAAPKGRRFASLIELSDSQKSFELGEILEIANPVSLAEISDSDFQELLERFVELAREKNEEVLGAAVFFIQEIAKRKIEVPKKVMQRIEVLADYGHLTKEENPDDFKEDEELQDQDDVEESKDSPEPVNSNGVRKYLSLMTDREFPVEKGMLPGEKWDGTHVHELDIDMYTQQRFDLVICRKEQFKNARSVNAPLYIILTETELTGNGYKFTKSKIGDRPCIVAKKMDS